VVVCAQHEAGGGGERAAGPDCGSSRRQEAGGGGKLGKVHVLGKRQVREPTGEPWAPHSAVFGSRPRVLAGEKRMPATASVAGKSTGRAGADWCPGVLGFKGLGGFGG
jgi:hypothetical protein